MRLNSVVRGYCAKSALLLFATFACGQPADREQNDTRPQHESLAWREFVPEELVEITANGRTAIIWIRADWDLESLIIEKKVFAAGEVVEAIKESSVVTMRLDITDPQTQRPKWPNWLDARSCPRLYVVGPGRHRIVILDGAIQASDVTAALGFVGNAGNPPVPGN